MLVNNIIPIPMNKFTFLIISIILTISIFSCKEEEFIDSSNIKLEFSHDTILFDTIFTTIGSITKQFTVKNPYNKGVKISSIELAGNTNSPYRLNIDGYTGNSLKNIELRKKDSIYIFVEITIDPTSENLPFVVQDSIVFSFDDSQQDIDLIAFGQNVHKINGEIIGTETWGADKPYLIYNSMLVDTLSTLTIEPGAKLYFHKESRLYVKGTINANGTLESPITFNGARLDDDYKDIPGQWIGIWLMPGSMDNLFNYTEIKNAIIGIQVDTLANTLKPTLQITNSKILNMTSSGIYAQGSTIYGFNNVIANCGQFAIALTIGGSYEFYHSTIANYWSYSTRNTPAVLLNNYYFDINNNVQARPVEKAIFNNCIITGVKENELFIDKNDGTILNYTFDHTLLQVGSDFTPDNPSAFTNVIYDEDPNFIDWRNNNYELDTLSIAKDKGKAEIGLLFPTDILQNDRTNDAGPDLGAYERIETK